MPVFDANLMLRTTGNLTVSESSSGVTIRGTPVKGMAVKASVPTAFADLDQIQVKVYDSADNSTYNLLAQSLVKTGMNTSPRDITVPFFTARKYVKAELVVTSTTAANINFGAVVVGVVLNAGGDWTRAESFE